MRKTVQQPTEHESLEQLLGDCAQMTPHWVPHRPPLQAQAPIAAQALHGVRVPSRSARLLDGMSEYGD
ncbi:hypothetical protein NMN56_032005 [Streptomyces iconiensis]|uniref:Uncharacterized protein n=1 Tax=Streptomyces iconiensis TaxID=1384038 RepID=A0ABT7A574_9ACTN|nr:hypothetical protein [Streptomyces iconiensis]MDJ1136492.1 hypothetical protein [Streptomyces iconiensis]